MSAALEDLGLSNRATNALRRGGVSTLEQLCAIPRVRDDRPGRPWRSHLQMILMLGQKTEAEIIAALERRGLDLAPVSPLMGCACLLCAERERRNASRLARLAADPDAVLDQLLWQTIAGNLTAQGVDPARASVIYAHVVEILTPEEVQTLGESESTTRLINDWRAKRANLVPFEPRAVADEAGA